MRASTRHERRLLRRAYRQAVACHESLQELADSIVDSGDEGTIIRAAQLAVELQDVRETLARWSGAT